MNYDPTILPSSVDQLHQGNDSYENHVKLFIGQIPNSWNESDLKAMLEKECSIVDATIIRDKMTSQHKCCAFVKASKESADKLISKFHNSFTFDGMRNPIQVKYANARNPMNGRHENHFHNTPVPHNYMYPNEMMYGLCGDGFAPYQYSGSDQFFMNMLPYYQPHYQQQIPMNAQEKIAPTSMYIVGNNPASQGTPYTTSNETNSMPVPQSQDNAASETINSEPPPPSQVHTSTGGYSEVKSDAGDMTNSHSQYTPMSSQNAYMKPFPMVYGHPAYINQYQPAFYYPYETSIPMEYATHARPAPILPNVSEQETVFDNGAAKNPDVPLSDINTPNYSLGNPFMPLMNPHIISFQHFNNPMDESASTQFSRYRNNGMYNPRDYDPIGSVEKGPPGANVIVSGLSEDFVDEDLVKLFSKFGDVLSGKILIDKKTMKSRQYGFVSFFSAESADNAVKNMNGFVIGQSTISVRIKLPDNGY